MARPSRARSIPARSRRAPASAAAPSAIFAQGERAPRNQRSTSPAARDKLRRIAVARMARDLLRVARMRMVWGALMWRTWIPLALVAAGCGSSDQLDGFTMAEWAKIKTHSPLPAVPADTTNKFADNPAAAKLGQRLFFDTAFSGPIVQGPDGMNGALGNPGDTGKVACASCHEAPWMFDTRAMPNNVGLGTQYMQRNVTSVLNASFYQWKETDGVRTATWNDALTDPEDQTSMHGNRVLIAHVLYKKYKADYEAIFGALDPALDPASPQAARFPANGVPSSVVANPMLDPTWYTAWDAMAPADQAIVNRIFANFGKAIQAYLRLMNSQNSSFDKYAAGDHSALDAAAKRGLHLFIGKGGCEACHSGPIFSDNQFHNIGIVETGPHVQPTEQGRFDGIGGALGDQFNVASEFSDDPAAGMMMINGVTATDATRGQWRTKGLRECAMTPPYEHTGQLATLMDVIAFDNRGGDPTGFNGTKDPLFVPLNLSAGEMSDLVEFLKSLTGDPPPAALTMNTAAP
jgi:cytochrome c peroxidase